MPSAVTAWPSAQSWSFQYAALWLRRSGPTVGWRSLSPRSVLPDIGDDQAREKVDARSTWSSVGATPV
jgi:hypothetical protein